MKFLERAIVSVLGLLHLERQSDVASRVSEINARWCQSVAAQAEEILSLREALRSKPAPPPATALPESGPAGEAMADVPLTAAEREVECSPLGGCGAKAGSPCLMRDGKTRSKRVHHPRSEAWREMRLERAFPKSSPAAPSSAPQTDPQLSFDGPEMMPLSSPDGPDAGQGAPL